MNEPIERRVERRVVRREVRRTERRRRKVVVTLRAGRAIRLGLRLTVRGVVAALRGRRVQLALHSRWSEPQTVSAPDAVDEGISQEPEDGGA